MPSVPPAPSAPEAPLVLVVEDDDDTRFLYAESLVHLGYRTAGERDGEHGVEAAVRLRPDAILMDAAMPGISGIEATRRIKADPRTSGSLVIMVTGTGMERFEEARAAGCDAYFHKPFDPSAVEQVLRTLSTAPEQPTPPRIPEGIVKRCSCGRELTREQWRARPLCGRMDVPRRHTIVEMRNCKCGSSLAVEIENPDDSGPRIPIAETACGSVVDAGPETIFVVDRDPHVRRLVLQFVGDAYLVEFFDDGYAALDRVRKSAPAVLVTEILVPRLDGLALCRLIKSDPVTQHVPVLVFSMLAADERARQAGANGFLEKPLDRNRMVASLRGLTEGTA